MSSVARLVAFAAVLAVLFAGAAVAGGAIDPKGHSDEPAGHDGGHGSMASESGQGTSSEADASPPVRGLAIAEGGLRLVVADRDLTRGRAQRVNFRIVDAAGAVVRDFDVAHTKRMHLIVVRRDLQGFQHLHPQQGGDGSWTVAMRLDQAGSYRLFADFTRHDQPFTLAADLGVDGSARLQALPPSQVVVQSAGGYRSRLYADGARPGRPTELRFVTTRAGRTVEAEPYLGAGGHLVALREGDLAFLHLHPAESRPRDKAIGFKATFPTAGRYRLFLQFKHEGRVRTVAFTQEVS